MGLIDSGDWKKTGEQRGHIVHAGNRSSSERDPRCVQIGYIDDAARELFGRFDDDEGMMSAMAV